ncbi:AEC family transporter [Marinicrinis sediminis]|uniref:AEC family transporter n=1 Tax=Marinicrinis sediminis TaxID=1652465 RepID=A0ABW5R7H7_9BACL
MSYFTHIFIQNIIPLSILIGAGILLQRRFQLDIKTLSKLIFYVFSPAIMFRTLLESSISASLFWKILLFFVIFFSLLILVTEIVLRIKWSQKDNGRRVAFRHSVLFYNSANYTLPLNQLVFQGNPFAFSVQTVIMVIQTILPYTYGVYSINSHKQSLGKTLKTVFSLPVIYAIPLAVLCNFWEVTPPKPIYMPISYIADGFIATALITLGAQLGSMTWRFRLTELVWSNSLRLLVSPLIGAMVVWMLGFDGILADALILSCAVPTALNTVLLAVEFDNEPEYASQTVLSSTVLSMFTVTLVLYFL